MMREFTQDEIDLIIKYQGNKSLKSIASMLHCTPSDVYQCYSSLIGTPFYFKKSKELSYYNFHTWRGGDELDDY